MGAHTIGADGPGHALDVGEHASDDGRASGRAGAAQEPAHLRVAHRSVPKALARAACGGSWAHKDLGRASAGLAPALQSTRTTYIFPCEGFSKHEIGPSGVYFS